MSSTLIIPFALTFSEILSDLKKKQFKPLYFLHGTEPFFIDAISDYIEKNALSEAEKAFNQVVLYGGEVDHIAVIDYARRYPMMAPFLVVILKEAQEMKDLKELAKYAQQPLQSTILVISHKHKSFNINTKFGKLLQEKGLVFESKRLYDNQLVSWITEHVKTLHLKISPSAAELLAEYLGTDLSVVARELGKLSLHLQAETEITPRHVETYVGISREYNVFELQKALSLRDRSKASRIMQNFIANPKSNPFIMTVASLAGFFTKVYMLHFIKNESDQVVQKKLGLRSTYALRDYRAALRNYPLAKTEQIIGELKKYDLMAKGVDFNTVGKGDGELLKELIWKILN